MIRGVKRQVIEVKDINNSYYEKAFLIVKPEYSDYHDLSLKREAKNLIKNFGVPSYAKRRGNISGWIIKAGIAVGIGTGIAALMMI